MYVSYKMRSAAVDLHNDCIVPSGGLPASFISNMGRSWYVGLSYNVRNLKGRD